MSAIMDQTAEVPDVDVLVVGAGGCGLVAAIAAHEQGASVAILEKTERLQGNTTLSSGSIPAAGTRFQRAAGIDDSAARMQRDLLRTCGAHDAAHLTHRLAGVSAELVEWLVDTAHVDLTLIETYRHVGHSVHRLHAPPSRMGADLLSDLAREVARRDIPLALGNRVTGLAVQGGRVRGAQATTPQGERSEIRAGATILATNGFGANRALLRRFCPDVAEITYAGAPGSEGEALEWGAALGAATGNIGAFQGHGSFADPLGILVTWTLVEKGAIIVDAQGTRFGDETVGYSAFCEHELPRPRPLFVIYDERIAQMVARGQREFAGLLDMGGYVTARTPQALAERTQLDPAALAQTLADVEAARTGHAPDPLGRSTWGDAALSAPLYATRIQPALFHTQGGLLVDAEARVLRTDGSVIEGLFAGGGAAAGISGREGSGGYASGNGLLSALGLGYIAGRAAYGQAVLHQGHFGKS